MTKQRRHREQGIPLFGLCQKYWTTAGKITIQKIEGIEYIATPKSQQNPKSETIAIPRGDKTKNTQNRYRTQILNTTKNREQWAKGPTDERHTLSCTVNCTCLANNTLVLHEP